MSILNSKNVAEWLTIVKVVFWPLTVTKCGQQWTQVFSGNKKNVLDFADIILTWNSISGFAFPPLF